MQTSALGLKMFHGIFGCCVMLSVFWLVGAFVFAQPADKQDKSKEANPPLTASQILDRMDRNMIFETRRSLATMQIHRRGQTIAKTMKIYSKGEDASYVEFLSPARDKGVKYLKLGDNLWMYLPSAEKIIKIAGHMLRQSMMGSDFSYEDMLDAGALKVRYDVKLLSTVDLDGRKAYLLELNQKKRGETYPKRKIWVDTEHFTPLRTEMYALSGRLLKSTTMSEVRKYGERYYPTVMRMEDKMREGTWTKVTLDDIQFKVQLPEQVFSLRNLQREN
jgi:outer membrane lipoprotein-sorting protein